MINRIEKKFILKKELYSEFVNFVEIKKKMKKKFNDRKINSIYFDNPNNKFVLDNLNGLANRNKFRIRWYNNNLKNVTFENKIKNGNKSQKIKNKIKLNEGILDILKSGRIIDYIPEEYRFHDLFTANSLISYNRSYYISDLCRLTIDRNIKYSNIKNNKLDKMFFEDHLNVVEIKINENNFESFFDLNFDLNPLTNVRMSKYMRARSFFLNFEYF